jgi:23S rRNA pseudouridine1911/1915/1917 synthase
MKSVPHLLFYYFMDGLDLDFILRDEDVVYLDNHLLVVNKPPGVLVQTDKDGSPSIEDAARVWLKKKFDKPGNVFATAAHRLDRPVGGLVVIARTSKALVRMNTLFQTREIRKVYLALVEGKPEQHKRLRHWIKKTEAVNKVWTYTYPRGDAKQADLAYWQVAKLDEFSLLMVRLFSGRHHQIRAQLAMEKLPILGDIKYGKRKIREGEVCLYSYGLEFVHPVTKEPMRLKGRIPSAGPWKNFSAPDAAMLENAFGLEFVP